MSLLRSKVPTPRNEPVRNYAPGSPERASLVAELDRQAKTVVDVPLHIGGERVTTNDTTDIVMPHDHRHVLGRWHGATTREVDAALDAAEAARASWSALPFEQRAAVFLKAADLLATEFRDRIVASTMLGQSKTAHQAEIDAACEFVDFLRFNVAFLERIYAEQPESSEGMWNRVEYRPLDGFVFAVTPFNFTAIGANLPAAPAICGNTTLWKPSPQQMLSAHYTMELFAAAGLPPGVINLISGPAEAVGERVLADRRLAGVHFTGSTATFKHLWKTCSQNLDRYRSYPRIVGETGGKDFVVAHASADVERLAVALQRGAFEYQGQKCSAASRAYVPDNLWPQLRGRLAAAVDEIRVGDVRDFTNFMGAVIDERAFDRHVAAIERAKSRVGHEITEVLGGGHDGSKGWFVRPTVIVSKTPDSPTMVDELFGPILTLHVYPAAEFDATLALCDRTSDYGLTGAIFAQDRMAIARATDALRFSAGNFYVNDKPTGAVVGQQPFGGARASGTNDKAGSMWNLMRWLSPRTIKECFVPPRDYRYPYMG